MTQFEGEALRLQIPLVDELNDHAEQVVLNQVWWGAVPEAETDGRIPPEIKRVLAKEPAPTYVSVTH